MRASLGDRNVALPRLGYAPMKLSDEVESKRPVSKSSAGPSQSIALNEHDGGDAASSFAGTAAAGGSVSGSEQRLLRMSLLWQQANTYAVTLPELSRSLLVQFKGIASSEGIDLPVGVRNRICGRCCTLLIPGINASVRVSGGGSARAGRAVDKADAAPANPLQHMQQLQGQSKSAAAAGSAAGKSCADVVNALTVLCRMCGEHTLQVPGVTRKARREADVAWKDTMRSQAAQVAQTPPTPAGTARAGAGAGMAAATAAGGGKHGAGGRAPSARSAPRRLVAPRALLLLGSKRSADDMAGEALTHISVSTAEPAPTAKVARGVGQSDVRAGPGAAAAKAGAEPSTAGATPAAAVDAASEIARPVSAQAQQPAQSPPPQPSQPPLQQPWQQPLIQPWKQQAPQWPPQPQHQQAPRPPSQQGGAQAGAGKDKAKQKQSAMLSALAKARSASGVDRFL